MAHHGSSFSYLTLSHKGFCCVTFSTDAPRATHKMRSGAKIKGQAEATEKQVASQPWLVAPSQPPCDTVTCQKGLWMTAQLVGERTNNPIASVAVAVVVAAAVVVAVAVAGGAAVARWAWWAGAAAVRGQAAR
eukprot:scaffold112498_cov20-Tisochrysis_lutea.AAC.2